MCFNTKKSDINRWLTAGLLLFLLWGKSNAQSPTFQTFQPISAHHGQSLSFLMESSTFFKNNEYFDPFAYGYTGIGFYAQPAVSYHFSDKFQATAGVYLLKYSGLDDFTQVIPIFRLRYKIAPVLELVMGNIYGTANHRLAEPLFRYDRFFQDHVEYGFQFLLHTDRIRSDLWLSWENYIQVGDTSQEQLLVGNSTRIVLWGLRHQKGFRLELPVQVLIAHKGGQLEPPPHKPVSTIFNALVGIKMIYVFNNKSSLQVEPDFLLYNGLNLPDSGKFNAQPYQNGWGVYPRLTFQYGRWHFMTGYWYAKRFISPHGEYLFQSVSEITPGFSQEKRELLTNKIWINKRIFHHVWLEARFESYYDLMSHQFDYSYGLYIVMNEKFFLFKPKSK